MQYTSSLNLKKPEGTDVVDINVLNENTDIIDMEITKKATQTLDGRMSKEDKKKLDGVEEGANNYTHPSTHAATMVTIADTGNNFASTNVEGALSELFTSVSNGKQQIATAITDVDNSLNPSGSDTFDQLANIISNISTGKKFASGTLRSDKSLYQMDFTVSTLTFEPSTVIIKYHGSKDSAYADTPDLIYSFAFRFPNGGMYACKRNVAWKKNAWNSYGDISIGSQITFLSNGFSVENFDVYETLSTIYWTAYE
ncbi:hypothetical protein [Wukongibacter sp. M2B1]|uniref:hypothetical protein n=1 Tax=Wukongibacter sp. M2B1 TaxID=3088895 RepID=UPI003D7912CB